jgi:hypothetical protein
MALNSRSLRLAIALPDAPKLFGYNGVYSGKYRRAFVSTVLIFLLKSRREFRTRFAILSLPPQEGPCVIDCALLTSIGAIIDTVPHTMTQRASCCYLVISLQSSTDAIATPGVLSVHNSKSVALSIAQSSDTRKV